MKVVVVTWHGGFTLEKVQHFCKASTSFSRYLLNVFVLKKTSSKWTILAKNQRNCKSFSIGFFVFQVFKKVVSATIIGFCVLIGKNNSVELWAFDAPVFSTPWTLTYLFHLLILESSRERFMLVRSLSLLWITTANYLKHPAKHCHFAEEESLNSNSSRTFYFITK